MLLIMYLSFRTQLSNERAEKAFYRDSFFRAIGVQERQATIQENMVKPLKESRDLGRRLDSLIAEVESLRDKL